MQDIAGLFRSLPLIFMLRYIENIIRAVSECHLSTTAIAVLRTTIIIETIELQTVIY